MAKIARLGDSSDHGGTIISAASYTDVNGIFVARVGDLHSCPIPGHGVTKIIDGSGNYDSEGKITAVVGSTVGCGAKITGGSSDSFAPLESPSNAFILDTSAIGDTHAVIG